MRLELSRRVQADLDDIRNDSAGRFGRLARREYVLLLTDLDRQACAPELINDWTSGRPIPGKLLFRVPVREIEAWLLADRSAMAMLMAVSEAALPSDPDALPDAKQALLNAARRATRDVRSELLAGRDAVASQGLGYNSALVTLRRDALEDSAGG